MELYDLFKRAKNNDKNATYKIIKDFSATLKKLSNSLHYEEAETDLIIELLKLIKNINIEKFKDSHHKQIAKYIHMHLRKRTLDLLKKNENKINEYIEINHDLLADESIADTENTVLTFILIKSLVRQQRDIITMEFIHGFSEKDIAQILKISRQAVNRAKNRALNNLRKIFIGGDGEWIGRKDHRVSRQSRYKDSTNSSSYILKTNRKDI
ncbi:RNA polymerase sigma factor [Marinisporobacter balticus]|uniref:RNA polymerase sigma factor (Sigma-70 family) n=1 Tax=Marinisporobacter balticus TaxID=2018667 RepID=A0A4R2KJ86_9FIRM|nr:sigma-70 family RNA polymerase sigma factor [Marinisporobacter balticus]TCO70636.1 RNA polymerase sigma factor (sigma-70 family) [Marinisporobacter balticus]